MGAVLLAGFASACSDDEGTPPSSGTNDEELAGLDFAEQPLLVAGCSIVTTVMTVIVKDGEAAFITLRPTDNKVVVNGHVFAALVDTGASCEIAPTGTISVIADTGGTKLKGRSVIVDYVNGLYMLGVGTTAGIKVDFTLTGDTGTLNSLKVRGSNGIDLFAVGAGTAGAYVLNANAKTGVPTSQVGGTGGATVTLDIIPDVTFKNVPTAIINAGAGPDLIDGSGVAGSGTAFPNALKLFGNDGADTLTGGLGADTISGGLGADILNGCAGDDTYYMGTAAAGADVIANACTVSTEGSDTVDYSGRTLPLTVNLSKTLTAANSGTDAVLSGEAVNDGAHISDKVVTVKLSSADDVILIPANSTVVHKVFGGSGDDSFTGGAAADVFDGENGDDTCIGTISTMDYSLRSAAITVTTCASGCMASDANDGNSSATGSTHAGTGAVTAVAGGIAVSTLVGTGFTAASVGNTITLSACAMAGTDDGDYPIVVYVSPTSVKIDVTSLPGFIADTCAFSEALPDATTNDGVGATVSVKRTTGSVTGLDHTTNMFGHTLTLTHTAASTGGGGGHTNDDGAYPVINVLSGTSVAIDDTAVGTYGGSVTAMTWSEVGSEHDNVQCGIVVGGSGGDNFTGDARNNYFRGGAGSDTLNGGAGDDTLNGEAGGDSLFGGAGDDTLVGGGGAGVDSADTLTGGDGNDVLQGDTGNDTFTCDGKNIGSDAAVGLVAGDSDLTVDFVALADLGGADCEF